MRMVNQVAPVIQDPQDRQGPTDNQEIKDNRVLPDLGVNLGRMEPQVLQDNRDHKDLAEVLVLPGHREPQGQLVI